MYELPELDGLSAAELEALLAAVRDEAAAITTALSDPDTADAADLDMLESLATAVETIQTAQTALATIATERAERAAALAARIAPAEQLSDDGDPEPEAPAEDAAAEEEEAAAEDDPADADAEAVVAGVQVVHNVTTLPPPRSVAKLSPKPKVPKAPTKMVSIVAAAGVTGLRAGQEATLMDFVKPAVQRWESYLGYNGRQQDELFSLKAPPRDPRLVANGHNDQDVVEYAINQSRLTPLPSAPAGATGLIAAGGWCAPAEQKYDICTLADLDGIYDVPTIGMPRGSISYFRQLDYNTVCTAIAAGEFTFTNAELVVDPPVVKPCFEIPCATPVTATLDVVGLCIRAGLLQQKAFPELIAAWMELALICFAHYRNARNLAQVVAGSTAVAVPGSFGAISAFLDAVNLQAMDYRFDNGMGQNATLELVAPWWLPSVLWSDSIRRQFEPESYTEADLRRDLASINIRAQFVKDLDDTPFTGALPVVAWPDDVSFLLYAPGAWLRGTEDVISVSSLVDSTLLQTNRIQLLFFEAADVMLPACGPSFYITVPLCPNGTTGGPLVGTGSNACPIA